ncbi:hypothetical protein KA005_16655 [bacterium]|nr:hypothetical protein [bacterium]
MIKRKSFSLGCLHFAFTKGFPIEISGSDYEKEITALLNKIEAVERLEVLNKFDIQDTSFSIKKAMNFLHGDRPVPYPMGFELSFDLYIPERFQKDICKKYGLKPETFTEHFNVILLYEYYAPVCLVECLNPSEFPEPSNAIPIIRDFMNDRISQIDDRFELQRLGPSPFHADFYLLEHKPEDSPAPPEGDKFWRFISDRSRLTGYDIWLFYYNPEEFGDINEAQKALYHQLSNEASVYYFIKMHQLQNTKEWISIENLSEEIFQRKNNSYVKNMIRSFSDGSKIENLVLRMSQFESGRLRKNTTNQSAISNVLNVKRAVFLETDINNLADEEHKYPIEQLRELIKFFDSQRSRILNSIAVVFAAIVGGMTGSLLTIFFSQP